MKWNPGQLALTLSVFAIVSAALLSCIGGAEGPGGGKPNPHWGKPVSGLSCSIRTDRAIYTRGEDILLDFFLRSEVETPTTVIRPWILSSLLGTALPLEIVGPKGRHKYTGPLLEPPLPPGRSAYIELTGGEIIGVSSFFKNPVRIVPKYWSMEGPGEYTISFTFRCNRNEYWDGSQKKMVPIKAWEGELLSNSVTVRIADEKEKGR